MSVKGMIVLLMLVACSLSLSAQGIDTRTVDQETYRAWQDGQWKSLIGTGRKAMKAGIDFYYLRVRMGVAWYRLGNYHMAVRYLEKARKMNPEDNETNELLYYALLFSGLDDEAAILAKEFPAELKKKTGADHKPKVSSLRLVFNTAFPSGQDEPDNYIPPSDTQMNGIQYTGKERYIAALHLTHRLSPRSVLTHGYTYTNQNHFVFGRNDSTEKTIADYRTVLHQYYLNLSLRVARRWEMNGGIHYTMIRFPFIWQNTPVGRGRNAPSSHGVDHNLSGWMSVYRYFPYVHAGTTIYYSELNQTHPLQADVHINVFPLGNKNLYLLNDVSALWLFEENESENLWGWRVTAGGRLARWCWAEGGAGFGNRRNFLSDGGMVVHNSTDRILQSFDANLLFFPSSRIRLSISYSYSLMRSDFVPVQYYDNTYNKIIYSLHSISGGLKWNF